MSGGNDIKEHMFVVEPGAKVDGRFELIEPLGRGGCAVVYRARQLSIDRDVAIKFLELPPSADPKALERFKTRFYLEAKSAGRIHHPGIVNILDYGVTHGGQPFIAMELLQGRDLRQELASNGPMDVQRALPLFVRCLDALQAAHALDIVHKDLKPSNLFLTSPGSMAEALRIVDFGVASLIGGDERMTGVDQFAGTAAYCAPEYYQHRIVSPAVDVYQMGLCLAELLTGQFAVEAVDAVAAVIKHLNGELSFTPELMDSPVGPLIAQATAYDPGDRFPDAGAFRDALVAIDPAIVNLPLTVARSSPAVTGAWSTDEGRAVVATTGDETFEAGVVLAIPTPQYEAKAPVLVATAREPEPPHAPKRTGRVVAAVAVAVLCVGALAAWGAGVFDKAPESVDKAPPLGAQTPQKQPAAEQPKAKQPPPKPVAEVPAAEEPPAKAPTLEPPPPVLVKIAVKPHPATIQRVGSREAPQTTGEGGVAEFSFPRTHNPEPWDLLVSRKGRRSSCVRLRPDSESPRLLQITRKSGSTCHDADPDLNKVGADGRFSVHVELQRVRKKKIDLFID